jgi:hypothetical protein
MLMNLLYQLLVHLRQLTVERLNLLVQPRQRLLIGELGVEVGDGVEVDLLKF